MCAVDHLHQFVGNAMPMEPMEISAKNSMVEVAGTSNGLFENAVDRMSLDDSVDGKTVPGKSSNK